MGVSEADNEAPDEDVEDDPSPAALDVADAKPAAAA